MTTDQKTTPPQRHHCSSCGYIVHVIGGTQTTHHGRTTTIHCHQCRSLQDVWLWTRDTPPPDTDPLPLCRRDSSHQVSPWTSGDPCPHCSTPLPAPANQKPVPESRTPKRSLAKRALTNLKA